MEKLEQKMGICPKCGSEDIEYDGSCVEGEMYYYEVWCNKCGCEYREYHNLVFCENVVKE